MRVLMLQHPGTNSRDIFCDIADGYRQAGHDVFVLELGPLWALQNAAKTSEAKEACLALFTQTVRTFVESNGIELCVCMWANGPFSLATQDQQSFFECTGVPVLMHWLDAPQWAHEGKVLDAPQWLLNGPRSFHYINNQGTAQEMAGVLGFSNILSLSNAASPAKFRPHPVEKKDFDIVFCVGADHTKPTPLMLAELKKDEPDLRAIRQDEAASLRDDLCDIIKSGWNTELDATAFVDQMIQTRLDCRDAPVLEQIGNLARTEPRFAEPILAMFHDAKRYVRFSMTLRKMEEWERAFTFTYLARHFRCATFGLFESFAAWPGKWERLGKLAYEDQAKAYSRARFGLNVMRFQDDTGLNPKPFEITLSGACLLQAYRSGIEEHFTDEEIVVFRTPHECCQRVAQLLEDPTGIERLAAAGRARSLAQHCWQHRAEAVASVFTQGSPPAIVTSPTSTRAIEEGSMLVFVLGLWRGGTTLLRKVLDSHSEIYAPAETWFLLPLINLWEGKGTADAYGPLQAASALRTHLGNEQFASCCRAFASRFYRSVMPPTARYFVDKTPFYIKLASVLPSIFPRARFLVLGRDPRATAWSRHTWKHIKSETPSEHFDAVAADNRILVDFLAAHPQRSLLVGYERLCVEPEPVVAEICRFLGLPYERGITEYGRHIHHEGLGDEMTQSHSRPHTESIDRWSGPCGMTPEHQAQLAAACGIGVLTPLGYAQLASLIPADAEPTPAEPAPVASHG